VIIFSHFYLWGEDGRGRVNTQNSPLVTALLSTLLVLFCYCSAASALRRCRMLHIIVNKLCFHMHGLTATRRHELAADQRDVLSTL